MKKEDWKEIIYKNGKIDEEQVMKELEDYGFILEEVPKVYCEITGGLLSKPNYKAEIILAEFNERFWDKEIIKDDITDILEDKLSDEEKLAEIKGYLELTP